MSELVKLIEGIGEGIDLLRKRTDERLASMQDRIERFEAEQDRPRALNGGDTKGETVEQKQYRQVFGEWLRKPRDEAHKSRLSQAVADLSTKDVTIGTGSQGGFALPEQISTAIERRVQQLNPFRQLVRVEQCSTNDFKALVDMGNGSAGWVGETGTRSATGTPELRERAPTMGEVYAYPQASEWSLDDLYFDVQRWLVDSVAEQFASLEATAIVSGNGTNRPTGFLNTTPMTTSDDNSPLRNANALQYLSLTSPTSPVSFNHDSLVALVHSLKEAYLLGGNVAFVMNRASLSRVRSMKDTTGQPIWQPNVAAGQPATLLGYPVYTCDAMPTYANDAFAIAFGNWARGYLLVDRVGMRITVDPYSAPGYVRFYVRRRLGGCVLNNDAVKMLRLADS
ncbi:MAG: phage major capsid protein [Gammaproteobacteria bacterium]|nr:phage major capsid protein [Gammaproteobacteria bacterium]